MGRRSRPKSPHAKPIGWIGLVSGVLALLLVTCAAPDAEIHLAPLFSRHTVPGYDHAEAFAGSLRYEREGETVSWALSPLLWTRDHPDGSAEADFLYPFGRYEFDPERPRTYARLFPLFWHEAETRPDGVEDVDWSFLTPFFWGGSTSDDSENYFAFFPVFGRFKNFLTYDEIFFVLWPLFLQNWKDERKSTHVLWPIVGWTEGSEQGWRIFPFYGETEVPGRYKSAYVLWPIVQWSEEELHKPEPRQGWLIVPLAGNIQQGDYSATTVLWPIFGTASRPSTGYRSWQVWPILKFERGGRDEDRELGRVLPFWQHYRDERVEFSTFLFPIFWFREEQYGDREKESFYAVPLYWESTTRHDDGRVSETRRFWPFARTEYSTDGTEDFAVFAPGIEPLLRTPQLSRNLGFVFEVWAGKSAGPAGPTERRAFLNLYHSAEAAGHKRWSLPGLGGVWTEPDGTEHYSFLFGLLRWRTGDDGGLEDPAFPGPGWPDLHQLAPPVAANSGEADAETDPESEETQP